MPTPTEHRQIAEAYFTRVTATGLTEPTHADRQRAEIHAILATRTGTGDHYTDAESTLTTAGDNHLRLHVAHMHALLADTTTA